MKHNKCYRTLAYHQPSISAPLHIIKLYHHPISTPISTMFLKLDKIMLTNVRIGCKIIISGKSFNKKRQGLTEIKIFNYLKSKDVS